MFRYFDDNYGWSLSVLIALAMGASIDDVDRACRPLLRIAAKSGPDADQAWMASWNSAARTHDSAAQSLERSGRVASAADRYRRAAVLYLLAERQVGLKSEATLAVYRAGLTAFARWAELSESGIEFVDVPFQGRSMPALYLRAASAERAPCVVHFDGLDVMKEIICLMGADGLPRRGVSVLVVDHPGVGEAVRLGDLNLTPRTEEPAAACIDYLAQRRDIDPERIGIMALSLGGYYAPRAAALGPRFAFCVAWGAIWNLRACLEQCERAGTESVPLRDQLRWVLGVNDDMALDALIDDFDLTSVMENLTCPLLVVHGGNDQQAPLWTAQRTYDAAINSRRRDLVVIETGDAGCEHCQLDDVAAGLEVMHDWIAEVTRSASVGSAWQ